MSARRSWVGRLSGGRTASATHPPPSRPEPGPGRPVRSGPPARDPPPVPGPRAASQAPEPEGAALRVVLVSRDNLLAGALRSLIESPGGVRMLDWHSEELDSAIRHADVVIVDMPPSFHQRTFAVINGRFLGRTVVLLQEGEHAEALPPGPARVVLYRPLQIGELWAAITGLLPPNPEVPPASAPDPSAQETPEGEGAGSEGLVPELPEPVVGPEEAADQPEPERALVEEREPEPEPGTTVPAAPGSEDQTAEVPRAVEGSEDLAEDPSRAVEGSDDLAEDPSRAVEGSGQGLPVAESGRMIGLSGRELEPVIGPGQVAPGMDEATFERLRRWGNRSRLPANQSRPTQQRRRAAAAREQARRRERAAQAEARRAARAQAKAARSQRAEARSAARQEARVKAAEARTARAAARTAARQEARQARAARSEARALAREQSRQARLARAQARRDAREEAGRASAVRAQARREQSRQAAAERAAQRQAAREEATAARAARAEEQKAAKAAQAEERKVARAQATQARAARAEERKAARTVRREESRQARSVRAEARRAARAEARSTRLARAEARRTESTRTSAAQAEVRKAARAEAAQARSVRAEQRRAARAETGAARAVRREESRRVRATQAEARGAARAEARTARAARREESRQARSVRAEARQAARAEAKAARASKAATRREEAARSKAERGVARSAAHAKSQQERAARAEVRKAARDEAAQARAARAEVRKAGRAEAAQARAVRAQARRVARTEAQQRKVTQAETRRAARAEGRAARSARRAEARQAGAARVRELRRAVAGAAAVGLGNRVGVGGLARTLVVVGLMAAVGLAAAGWRGDGGPDTLAGEVAAVRAVGAGDGGLAVQDQRIGPLEPVYALAVGAWLRVSGNDSALEAAAGAGGGSPAEAGTGAEGGSSLRAGGGSALEAAVRAARGPGRLLTAAAVGLAVLLSLLLMRVGPGTGAAAGPGPTPPQRLSVAGGRGAWRLGVAALAGVLVALDPLVLRAGRTATGTSLALVLALGALALAWAVPSRPALRWLPLVGAAGGLALLVSPLALPVLAVPAVAALLEGRSRQLGRALGALGLGVGLWLVLPVWVAGQELGAGQAGWLLGRPPGRESLAATLAASPLSWVLVAAGLVAALLTWRLRSGARPDDGAQAAAAGPGAARLLAWVATTVAGALVAMAIGYPAGQALPFAVPAAAVAVALAAGLAAAAVRGRSPARRALLAGVALALAGLVVAQGLDWGSRYGERDDGLGRLVASVAAQVPECAVVNAGGPDDQARLLAAGVTVTGFSTTPAAQAAGVRYFVLSGGSGELPSPALAAWVRQHGSRISEHPSPSYSRLELWRVEAGPLDPIADSLPVPGGVFSYVAGTACGGYRVVDNQTGAFHSAYQALGGKPVLGRPLGRVWTSDGPALQAFDTMVLGAVPASSGLPAVRPIELPPLLAKLNAEAVAAADIPLPSTRPPVTDDQTRTMLTDGVIARAYLGTDPAAASADDWQRARDRFGRPLGLPQVMPDGAVRQPFEQVVLELPAGGGPARPAALGRLAVRLGLVPERATMLESSSGRAAPPAQTRLDTGQLLRLLGGGLALLMVAAAAGALRARRGSGADAAER